MKNFTLLIFLLLGIISCSTPPAQDEPNTNTKDSGNENAQTVIPVNMAHFTTANSSTKVTEVDCTLSDGTKAKCFQIVTNSTPEKHSMGPWCPDNISDDASAGGIWLNDGKVYDVDGAFIKNLASLYNDKNWKMYDAGGKVQVTETKEDCINAANPNVGEEYQNFCVECLPSFVTSISRTWTIPVKPVLQEKAVAYRQEGPGKQGKRPDGERPPRGEKPPRGERPERGNGPGRDEGGLPSTRGIALNGVEFSAPAPLNAILGAYTLAPFDDAGGHINVHQGYHYHAATGMSFSVAQSDGHAPLIGYAMDGHGIYAQVDKDGKEPSGLDECRGHYDPVRGYHYHADAAGNNNFINCLHGAYASN